MVIQQKKPAPPDPVEKIIQREMKQGQLHRLRIKVTTGSEINPVNLSYSFLCKSNVGKDSQTSNDIDFKLEDYSTDAEGLHYHAKLAGAGKLKISGSGLPEGIMDNIKLPVFWYPLLSLYLPSILKDGSFDISEAVGSGVQYIGKGTLSGRQFAMDGNLERGDTKFATVTLKWNVSLNGWLETADGSVSDPSGITTFEVRAR